MRPRVILICGWVVFLIYAYPGVMTMDSFDQLKEARAWHFTDSHPPVMAVIWGIVDRLIAGPFGMLVLQSAAFITGVYLLLARAMSPRAAAITACAVVLFPPVLAPMAMIWKDCMMAGVLVLGIAGLLDERRRMRLLGLGAIVLATALRYNALAATLPLVVLLFEWQPGKRWYVRYSLALGVWLAVSGLALGMNALLTDRKMHFWYSSLALADIVGTLAHVDGDIPDAELRPLLAPTLILVESDLHQRIRSSYKPYEFSQLVAGDKRLWDVRLGGDPLPPAQREAIGHAWTELVSTYPGAFISHRFSYFRDTLGMRRRFRGVVVFPHAWQHHGFLAQQHLARGFTAVQDAAHHANVWLVKHTRLFRPHVYALLALGLLLLCRRQRDVLAILASGLCMELSMLPLGATPDYRYSHWLVTCACLGLVMLFARRYADRDVAAKPA